MKVLAFPLSKITIAFTLGLVLSLYISMSLYSSMIMVVVSAMTAILVNRLQSFRHSPLIFAVSTYTVWMFLAFSVRTISDQTTDNRHFINQKNDQESIIEFELREKLRTTSSGQRYIADILSVNQQNSIGKIAVTFKQGDEFEFGIGDRFITYTKFITHRQPMNPGQFDYGKYLANKGIHAQIFVENNSFKKIGTTANLWHLADKYRKKIIGKLAKSGFNERELHVVSALLLGQQQEISPEIIKSYQFAGAVHILSVSGLHIGMIAMMLGFLLNRLPNTAKSRIFKALTIILVLWIFGLIAGFSPSVVRSVTMFSFLTIGTYLRRSTNIYHTLLVSALAILFVEPSFLLDVGFQLSYAALFFILWLQPLFDKIWTPQHKIVKYFWDILTVSFAAQIGTLPLSIYYFHQFPGLFFITNLVIIPWLSIVMAIGVLVILLAAADLAIPFLLHFLEWAIHVLNLTIAKIASYENFIFEDIPLTFASMILLYIIITSMALYATERKFRFVALTLTAILSLQVIKIESIISTQKSFESMIMYAPRSTVLIDRHRDQIIAYADDTLESRTISGYLLANRTKPLITRKLGNMLFLGKRVLIIDSIGVYPTTVRPDIVLLTQSTKVNLDRLIRDLKPPIIVADGSNFRSRIAKWEQSCLKMKIPFHAIGEKGSYTIE